MYVLSGLQNFIFDLSKKRCDLTDTVALTRHSLNDGKIKKTVNKGVIENFRTFCIKSSKQ